jgi:glucose-6-phosphate dehydrogenase assembly protein OpcA
MENTVTRARTATLVAVGPASRLAGITDLIGAGGEAGALHIVRISTDGALAESGDARPDAISIGGLRPEHVNNAIAGVRLSSLPTIVWWRGGPPEGLDGVASLADRVVLDAEDPWDLWTRTPPLFEHTVLTDIRWARLTRWRAALAHFFDLPQVRSASSSFSKLAIAAADRAQAALFAGWVDASLGWQGRVHVELTGAEAAMASVTLSGPEGELRLEQLPAGGCVSTEARVGGDVIASRVVSLGDQAIQTLMSEELRVRSRDLAFERAVQSALGAR